MDRFCVRCRKTKLVSEFYPSHRSWCKECVCEYARSRRIRKRPQSLPGFKRCPACRQELSLDRFRPRSKGGVYAYCRDCTRRKNEEDRRAKVVNPRGPQGTQWASWRTTGEKFCRDCGGTKKVSEFEWDSKRQRPQAYCRACSYRRHRAFMRTVAGKASARRYHKNRRDKRKHTVRLFTNAAVQLGVLAKQPCEVCGVKKVQAHHDDYSKPLDVRWLCLTHHAAHHKTQEATS